DIVVFDPMRHEYHVEEFVVVEVAQITMLGTFGNGSDRALGLVSQANDSMYEPLIRNAVNGGSHCGRHTDDEADDDADDDANTAEYQPYHRARARQHQRLDDVHDRDRAQVALVEGLVVRPELRRELITLCVLLERHQLRLTAARSVSRRPPG